MKLREKFLHAGLAVLLSVGSLAWAQADDLELSYELSFREAQAHYADVVMNVSGLDREYLDLKMAVWAPGSYLIREFSKNVEGFAAAAGGKALQSEKISKNTWRIYLDKAEKVRVNYRVYAFEMSVRTSFINSDHAYLNGTSIFMFVDKEPE
ncbi:MAG TPA: peptidase M61, partial [Anseongella sp.]|nr:peptidase M61 [Anseongella sp.]